MASIWQRALILGAFPALFAACTAAPAAAPAPKPEVAATSRPGLVVNTEWLASHLQDANLRIVDLREEAKYREGHIPGAVNQPVAQIYDNSGPIKGLVLPKEQFESLMGGLGVGDESLVVAVDDSGGSSAARLLWNLEYYGYQGVVYLDGGFKKWESEKRETTRTAPKVATAKFTAKPDPSKLATKEQVLDSIRKPGVVIVDARSPAEYRGEDVRSARGGHIPGAININWTVHLTEGDVPVLKPLEELRRIYESAGVTKDKEVIAYCQTGTRSAHAYLVLKLLGYERVRNYDGSWAEWGNVDGVPIEK